MAHSDDAAVTDTGDAVAAGEAVAVPTAWGLLDGLVAALKQRGPVTRASRSFAAEAIQVAFGNASHSPEPTDWRFKDPAWSTNPMYSRLAGLYLAWCAALDEVVEELVETSSGDQAERARFIMNILATAASPTNTLLGNPAALKKTFESGGANLVKGFANFVSDVRHNGGMPSQAKRGAFAVGEDLAATPGEVVHRDAVAELIQYKPSTEQVFELPTLVVPPPIGRFYFLDLRPGRSFVEHAVSQGLQTFLISWRNPTSDQSAWNIDTYAERILDAVDATLEVTGAPSVNLIGFCAGGILNSIVLNKLADESDKRVHSAAFAVTLLDFGQSAPINAFSSARLIDLAGRRSKNAGVTSARAMSSAFTWMRPNDLVWNYWVNNYLMGQDPPIFDILAWNADGTNLPSALHEQFLDMFVRNPLPTSGAMTGLGVPVDLGSVQVPTFVVGAVNDHLTPWRSTFQTTQLLGGESTFVLSNAGHIAALVNPPGNPKASYFTGPPPVDHSADEWFEASTESSGSWWERWVEWVSAQAGARVEAPSRLGSAQFQTVDAAPGLYVHQ